MARIRARVGFSAFLPALAVLGACSTHIVPQWTGPPPVLVSMVEGHNRVRAQVKPRAEPSLPALTWSPAAAEVARAYAARCRFRHNARRGPYGENLFAMSDHQAAEVVVPAAIRSWSAEAGDYDFARNACDHSKVCGHYTQMVWRDTRRVGCAIRYCGEGTPFGRGSWTLVVCNYDPPGNFIGRKPY
jgi:pathogenesis-related protein 1